ncbi:putative mediator of RNA polymerase II transcription subunit 23 isoform X2 [Schistocerca piceifrons]|uniref:putative mediator of RNA polymerase II transcription subunit 23 isoform X2 n=1 Tax=Schistocerca piceifrons TaxID=274613 RepID=UPI001F5E5C3D|nr:putative mediator of RNA polymerase II transcription subunit 23 isoform X2 [Schistocerca piceifrons]
MAAKNALDKRRCNSSEDETQYSSRDYGDNNDGDNTLLAVDSHSVSSSSSEEYGGYVNNGLQSDEDSETGIMDVSQIVETVLRQPVSPALRISESSDVHVGPSLTYNGPVTINVTVQPQSEHQATPPQSDPQLECQLELRNQIQPQLQTEHPPEQQPISHAQIQSQTQIQHPPQQQPLQTQNEIREPPRQQPLSQTLDEPLPHTQQPRLQQPQTMVQRNLQTYGQDFRTVKPSGCQLIAAELARKGQLTGLIRDVGADVVQSCCERNIVFIVLLVVLVTVCGISLSLVVGYRRNASPSRPSVDTTVKGTSPNELNTENPQNITVAVGQETGSTTTTEKQISDKSTIATEKTNSGQTYNYNSQTNFVKTTSVKHTTTTETQISGSCQHFRERNMWENICYVYTICDNVVVDYNPVPCV